ncbi:GNAT family N-acetyltransferase [Gorillibacterium massiliense]|uniref:GNAT family N-acetyltransferase n=1 Tax=Gorillibacterium massiliense TaxID=1280390 RepID=UPI0004BB9CA4|nr:GNAT family N-acetyltransferase [Gorillibacterium massiliense]
MNISVVEQLKESHVYDLQELFQQEQWTRGRKQNDIEIMLTHSFNIGLIDEDRDKLIGFSRVVTDFVYRATIYDVIVHADYQGKGLGRKLLGNIVSHPRLKDIERIELYCVDDRIDFYRKWEFARVNETTNIMRRVSLSVGAV